MKDTSITRTAPATGGGRNRTDDRSRRPAARLARTVLFAAALAVASLTLLPPAPLLADFAVYRGPSHILSLFALPGQTVPFDLAAYSGNAPRFMVRYRVEAPDGVDVRLDEASRFNLTAPQSFGIFPVTFQEVPEQGLPEPLPYRVQLVVMHPASEVVDGRLAGYPVGMFPADDSGEPWTFEEPAGFVEVTDQNENTLLSDHITLGDLQCKLNAPYPHYLATHTALLVKLETLSDQLLQRGLPGDHIKVMSGFRTPEYNRAIGNHTTYSRHIAGDAADIFIDGDGNGAMDDLNHDGRINRKDAQVVLSIIDAMDHSETYASLVGGASAYRATHEHGPFVHVDTRGYPARW